MKKAEAGRTKRGNGKKERTHSNRRKTSEGQINQLLLSIKSRLTPINCLFFLFSCLCLGFLIFIRTHQVVGQSMLPALDNHDRLFILRNQSPERYALVTFELSEEERGSFIKRVVGVPGDRLFVKDNTLIVLPIDEVDLIEEDQAAWNLPDGAMVFKLADQVANQLKNIERIPADNYLVIGDNRRHSTDSRSFGLLPKASIEGVVAYRYFPLNRIGSVT